jgi:hypothetical protein
MKSLRLTAMFAVGFLMAGLPVPLVQAQEVVSIGWGKALLTMPAGKPRAVIVLVPGGDGDIGLAGDGSIARDRNWIVRTRGAYARAGMASLLLDSGASISTAVAEGRKIAPRVIVVAMSRGSTRVPSALSSQPDGLVLASSFLEQIQGQLGSPAALPPTLVVHHRGDSCARTDAGQVAPFMGWAGNRARLVWISGGTDQGNPCGNQGHHGFVGREGAVVSAIIGFAQRIR